jgi:Ca-activated chloride channel family protein
MSFLAPWRLLLVVAPLVLLAAYVVMQRRRHKYAVRFTSVDLLASVLPKRAGWPRHISAALLCGALSLLVVGLARPTHAVRVARERGTIILTLDTSASMGATDVAPNRLAAAQEAARSFVDAVPEGLQVGLVSFDRAARVLVAPTTDHTTVMAAIDDLRLGAGTATGEGIYLAIDAATSVPAADDGQPAPAVVVLMSDGTPTIGRDGETPEQTALEAAAAARDAGIPVDTIAYGTDHGTVEVQGQVYSVPVDEQALARIAEQTDGQSFTAETGHQLSAVYDQIRRAVGYDTVRRDISTWFVSGALVALVLAAAAALVWNQRLV